MTDPHTERPRTPALSYELFPPRSEASRESLLATLDELAPTAPDHVSVTTGADALRRRRSLSLLHHLVHETPFRPLAHVLCVGPTEAELTALISDLLDVGVRGILALRGDRPAGVTEAREDELPFARHLVDLIRRVERDSAHRLCGGRVSVGVAAYPVKHPESTSVSQDLEVLLAKQRAGADFAITQVYPQAEDYEKFVARARKSGVELPIVPGILPVTGLRRYLTVCRMAGVDPDPRLAHELETAGSDRLRHQAGVKAAVRLARTALDAGAPGLHLYTFNEHHAALDVLEQLDLPRPVPPTTDDITQPLPLTPEPTAVPNPEPTRTNREETTVTSPNQPNTAQYASDQSAPAKDAAAFPAATILGYPRLGPRRELKSALESYWAGRSTAADLDRSATELRDSTVAHITERGLEGDSAVPAGHALYDQVLDTLVAVGAVPERFSDLRVGQGPAAGSVDRDGSFVLARGDAARQPLEMTKWFDTNYHYLVPEIGPTTTFTATPYELIDAVTRAAADGRTLRPSIVGPVTFLALAKDDGTSPTPVRPLDRLEDLLPVYADILAALRTAGAQWVQIEEPALVADFAHVTGNELRDAVERAAGYLAELDDRPKILVTTPYGDAGDLLAPLVASGVEAVHVDLVRGGLSAEQVALFTGEGAPTLVAGVVNGRNIWRTDLDAVLTRLESLRSAGATVSVATSTSLIHVPHTLEGEDDLDPTVRSWLAFADEKITEVVTLARGLAEGREAIATALEESAAALTSRVTAPGVVDPGVRERAARQTPADTRQTPAHVRREAQSRRRFGSAQLPPLPTTTIGSFPQTGEVRKARADFRLGRIDREQYEQFLRAEITRVVELQEDLGLDVLVHGEPERNDMVQYFAENFDGFAVTSNGWVQSYGSRATRPSILWGDVSRAGEGLEGDAFTVPWIEFAQSLTQHPVKGMLTGPVTILAWSFVREDQPLGHTADQVALALRDEIADLEAAGIGIIQVDEPALRELLPLRRVDRTAYLDWAVDAFRRATAGAADDTQIHTHLCYSEFGDVIEGVDALDADVTSIEAARSRMEVLADVRSVGFSRGLGPGVWDIHSPRVPSVDEIESLLISALEYVDADLLWANPDCGLKTRGYRETEESLRNLVAATARVRERLRGARLNSGLELLGR
ncbi:5-methyltetrahydropteroyltriglutamate--homocysteine S-methyltransferase [Kocuria soli]|uniref:5-methyltetrahydropteroyltriglutamate-- homocysteine S-methyltransferase n=1 Tax=Kocuria soli TaxID=2485125 RepID=UPI000F4E47CC|nr:5-methyltetrahydropteroyltriglutamate--homocysteine S-methyltransferase [Kocuria soli]